MDEQRTTNVLFQRVQRLGGAGDVTLLHKGHEDGELAEGNVIGDRQVHRPPRALEPIPVGVIVEASLGPDSAQKPERTHSTEDFEHCPALKWRIK